MRCFGERAASGWWGWLKLDKGGNPAFGVQPARQNALCEGVWAVLSGCHGAFDSPLRGLRLPNRPGLPGVFSALMRQVRAPTSWRCPSKRAPALTSCLDRLLEGDSSVRRYLRHERMGVFRPSLWFHRSPTGHSPREPRISRAFASAARATAQEVVALAGLASIHPPSCGRSGVLVRRSKERLLCPSMLGIACSEAHYTKR